MLGLSRRATARHQEFLADEFVNAYVRWRETCELVARRYDACESLFHGQGSRNFGAYLLALDQEESAARRFELASNKLRRCLSNRSRPASARRRRPWRRLQAISASGAARELPMVDTLCPWHPPEFWPDPQSWPEDA